MSDPNTMQDITAKLVSDIQAAIVSSGDNPDNYNITPLPLRILRRDGLPVNSNVLLAIKQKFEKK